MRTLSNYETSKISGGVVFGPAMINGYSSFIVMLEPGEDFYYYRFNDQSSLYFKNDGSVFSESGPVASDDYRTFINQSGYRCYFLDEDMF